MKRTKSWIEVLKKGDEVSMQEVLLRGYRNVFRVCMFSIVLSPCLRAESETVAPMWWGDRGVVDGQLAENNQGVASVGQAKWMATQALEELEQIAPDLARNIDLSLVFAEPPLVRSPTWYDAQKLVLSIGQLKSIAHQFYQVLPPEWLADQVAKNGWIGERDYTLWGEKSVAAENLKLANVGQLKAVFSLRFRQDEDNSGVGDTLPDLWEIAHFGSLEATAHGDADGDGYTNGEEQLSGGNPNDPSDGLGNALDTDGDGADDAVERAEGTDENDPQSVPENRVYFEYRYTEKVQGGEEQEVPASGWSEYRLPMQVPANESYTHTILAGGHYSKWYNSEGKWELMRERSVELRLVQLLRHDGIAEQSLVKAMTGSYGDTFDGNHARVLPHFFEGEGGNIAEILHFKIEAGARYSDVIEISGGDIARERLQALAEQSEFAEACGVECANYLTGYSVSRVNILPDYNRDGKIGEHDRGRVSEENPFRWWVNDDRDVSTFHDTSEYNQPTQSEGNHTDMVVNSESDFVDFFGLSLELAEVLELFPETMYSYQLSHAESALHFFEAEEITPMSSDISTGPRAFLRANSWILPRSEQELKPITPAGVSLTNSFLNRSRNREGMLVCEVVKASEYPLVLSIFKGSDLVVRHAFHMKTSGVEDMFRHVNISHAVSTEGEPITSTTVPSRTSEPSNYPDRLTNSDAFVMVHGYYPGSDKASENQEIQRGFYSELFKRMHQSGSKAQFVGLTWHSATRTDYHKAAYNAFKSSEVLKNELSFISGDITVAAHSLGNVLVSNAIAHESFRPKNYFMINSASPIEAYEAAQVIDSENRDMIERMIEKEWKPYDEKLYANSWALLFPEDDGRSKLTWRNRFKVVNARTNLVNYYTTGEDVVANPCYDDIDAVRQAWAKLSGKHSLGRYAWANQEFIKGGTSIGSFLFEDNYAGWGWLAAEGTTPSHYMLGKLNPLNGAGSFSLFSAEEAKGKIANGEITNEHLAQFHYFKPFSDAYAALSAPIDDANKAWQNPFGTWYNPYTQPEASALAHEKKTQWKVLSSGMASSTEAAAANAVLGVQSHNMMDFKNGWPVHIGRNEKYQEDWQHSDFCVISYNYVYKLFDEMIEKGELQ